MLCLIWPELRGFTEKGMGIRIQPWGRCTLALRPVPCTMGKQGGLILTCQKTNYQTHSHGQAQCPNVQEQLVVNPRNDKAEYSHIQASDCRDQKGLSASVMMLSGRATRRTNVLSPGNTFPCHIPAKPHRHVRREGGSLRSIGLLQFSEPMGDELDQEAESPGSCSRTVTSCIILSKSLNLSEPQVSS